MQEQTEESGLKEFFIDDEQPKPGKQLRRLIPNFLTLCGLGAGMLAIQKAVLADWDAAVLLIVFAAVIDTMDGALARLLRATSKFGAELDSLADFLSFGVAPGMVIYLWALNDAGPVGWIACMVFAMACALRLARFNSLSGEDDPRPEWARKFFMGVPAPGGAGLALMPIIITLALPESRELNFLAPLIGVWMLCVAVMMVSRMPTLSSKQIKLPRAPMVPLLAIAGAFLAAMIHIPWVTLSIIGTLYAAMIPLSWHVYAKAKAKNEAPQSAAPVDTF